MTESLRKLLVRHEDIKLKLYRDSVGKMTIGVGRNLDDNGISKEEALHLLDNDLREITAELFAAYPWVSTLKVPRQDALIDMAFNLGLPRFGKFKKMLAALENQDYRVAALEMLDSKWARQVGNRAIELANMVEQGQYMEKA